MTARREEVEAVFLGGNIKPGFMLGGAGEATACIMAPVTP